MTTRGYCKCIHYTKGRGWTFDPHWNQYVCSDCRLPSKQPQIYSYDCECCESQFLKNFSHPAFQFDHPMCWGCLEEFFPDALPNSTSDKLNKVLISIGKKPPPQPVEEDFDIFADPF